LIFWVNFKTCYLIKKIKNFNSEQEKHMSNKRSKRKNIKHFFCPLCHDGKTRLWRLGSTKHYIFYKNAQEIRQNLPLSAKKAAFLASQNSTYLDTNNWLEEFFCPIHGKMWLYLSSQSQQELTYRLSTREDWRQTNKTYDPTNPHPSVSEFSYRISRKSYYQFNS
jgi:hypothetical protein